VEAVYVDWLYSQDGGVGVAVPVWELEAQQNRAASYETVRPYFPCFLFSLSLRAAISGLAVLFWAMPVRVGIVSCRFPLNPQMLLALEALGSGAFSTEYETFEDVIRPGLGVSRCVCDVAGTGTGYVFHYVRTRLTFAQIVMMCAILCTPAGPISSYWPESALRVSRKSPRTHRLPPIPVCCAFDIDMLVS
jgi:hypothetical protein